MKCTIIKTIFRKMGVDCENKDGVTVSLKQNCSGIK